MKVAGIDIGQHGAIAVVEFQGPIIQSVMIYRFHKSDLLNREHVQDIFRFLTGQAIEQVFIENCQPHPKNGSSSWKKLGMWFGTLHALSVAGCFFPYIVSPLTWQTALKCRTGGDKNVSKRKAQALFKKVKVVHDIADALLIAYYGHLVIRDLQNTNRSKNMPCDTKTVKTAKSKAPKDVKKATKKKSKSSKK